METENEIRLTRQKAQVETSLPLQGARTREARENHSAMVLTMTERKTDTPHVTYLSPEAWEKFCDAINNPKPPTEALKRLMRTVGELAAEKKS